MFTHIFTKKPRRIFLDYAAGTPVSERALDAYTRAIAHYGNPQGQHHEGRAAREVLEDARARVARALGVKRSTLTFTSGGTEANNLCIKGFLHALEVKGVDIAECHVVVSAIEHPSVLEVLAPFQTRGLEVGRVAPDARGVVTPERVREALRENTVLVSVALVNSEIGTVQPLSAIARVVHKHQFSGSTAELEMRPLLHTDATQGLYTNMQPHALGADLLTLDSGKVYAPRGIGVVYAGTGVELLPVLYGGSQEQGLRPGTENPALAAGCAVAFEEAAALRTRESARLTALREALVAAILQALPDAVVNGTHKKQSPHILNISVPDIDAAYVASYLDQHAGIALATKSACLEQTDANHSHVVAALGGEAWRATNTLRLSFGRGTRERDVAYIARSIAQAVAHYRSFS